MNTTRPVAHQMGYGKLDDPPNAARPQVAVQDDEVHPLKLAKPIA